jgi:hypothetical protein
MKDNAFTAVSDSHALNQAAREIDGNLIQQRIAFVNSGVGPGQPVEIILNMMKIRRFSALKTAFLTLKTDV